MTKIIRNILLIVFTLLIITDKVEAGRKRKLNENFGNKLNKFMHNIKLNIIFLIVNKIKLYRKFYSDGS